MVLQRKLRPSIARVNWTRGMQLALANTPPLQSTAPGLQLPFQLIQCQSANALRMAVHNDFFSCRHTCFSVLLYRKRL